MNNTDVPIWEKYTLTIEEAVLQKYFKGYSLYKEKTYKLFPYIY